MACCQAEVMLSMGLVMFVLPSKVMKSHVCRDVCLKNTWWVFIITHRWSLPPTLVTLASFSFLLANPSLRSFYIWTDMTSMSFVRSFLSHPLTQALLASGDCVWFSAQGDMTPSFHSPEVKCLRWHRQREQSHNLLSNKNVKLTVWHSNLRGCLIYILSHKAVRRFPDVWHCNKVLIFCLTRPHIKIIALTLERE